MRLLDKLFLWTYLSPNDSGMCVESYVSYHLTHKRPTLLIGEYGRDASVLIDDNPRILRGSLEDDIKEEVFKWIRVNKYTLLKYWCGEYSTFELLLGMEKMDMIIRRNITKEEVMPVSKDELLSVEEEVRLVKQIQNGEGDVEAAKNKLLKANQRFVRSVAKQYATEKHPIDELIVEGNKGVEAAVYKYVETRGFKFISYAVWFIRRYIEDYLIEQLRWERIPLEKLSEREQGILKSYYGIGCEKVDFDEICAKYGLTSRRLLYIKCQVLRKLFIKGYE